MTEPSDSNNGTASRAGDSTDSGSGGNHGRGDSAFAQVPPPAQEVQAEGKRSTGRGSKPKSSARSDAAKRASAIRKQKLKEREEAMDSFMQAWNSAREELEPAAEASPAERAPEQLAEGRTLARPGDPDYPAANTEEQPAVDVSGGHEGGDSSHTMEDAGEQSQPPPLTSRSLLQRYRRGPGRFLSRIAQRAEEARASSTRSVAPALRPMSFVSPARRAQMLMTHTPRGQLGMGVRTSY